MKTLYKILLILFLAAYISLATYAVGTSNWSHQYDNRSTFLITRMEKGAGSFSQDMNLTLSEFLRTLVPITIIILVVKLSQKIYSQIRKTEKKRKKSYHK